MHDSPQWDAIKDHLPDPATATPQALEMQADILRARRFPEDARDYYKYAMARGGKQSVLLNKLGMTELEMKNVDLAKAYFQRSVRLNRKDPEAWNNLGAVEYMDGNETGSIGDYKRAIKLGKGVAVFHANLGTTYFAEKEYKAARREIASAMKLDPQVFEHQTTTGGLSAHVLSSSDRARFAFEMAKLYAQRGAETQMLHSLAMASEAGMDLQREMRKDPVLAKFVADKRVVTIVLNTEAMGIGGSTMGDTLRTWSPEGASQPAAPAAE
jgi:tetratricopeptide (TPR) repeat protein